MAHYINGPKLKFRPKGRPRITLDEPEIKITFRDFEICCERITSSLGEGYLCVPEKITEGGILFKKYPGRKNKFEYKTFRVNFRDYPFIREGMDKGCKMTIGYGSIDSWTMSTSLKAFHGAPRFNYNELTVITHQLQSSFTHLRPSIHCVMTDRSLERSYKCVSKLCRLTHNRFEDVLEQKRRQFAMHRIKCNEITNFFWLKVYRKRLNLCKD